MDGDCTGFCPTGTIPLMVCGEMWYDMTNGTEGILSAGKFHIARLMLGDFWSRKMATKTSKCQNFLLFCSTQTMDLMDCNVIWPTMECIMGPVNFDRGNPAVGDALCSTQCTL